jgi:hypothetical protein
MFFAPFHRTEQEHFSKPLLPTATNNIKPNPSRSPIVKPVSPSPPTMDLPMWPHPPQPDTPPHLRRNSVTFHTQPHITSRESFERTQNTSTSFSPPSVEQFGESLGPQSWSSNLPHGGFSDMGFSFPGESSKAVSAKTLYPPTSNSQTDHSHGNMQMLTDVDSSMIDVETETTPNDLLTTIDKENDAYPGSYWYGSATHRASRC